MPRNAAQSARNSLPMNAASFIGHISANSFRQKSEVLGRTPLFWIISVRCREQPLRMILPFFWLSTRKGTWLEQSVLQAGLTNIPAGSVMAPLSGQAFMCEMDKELVPALMQARAQSKPWLPERFFHLCSKVWIQNKRVKSYIKISKRRAANASR